MPMTEGTRRQFEQEERAYWQQREKLLKSYPDKWVAIIDGEVVAVGDDMNLVGEAAFQKTDSNVMFVTHVGHENIEFKIRQVATGFFDRQERRALQMVRASIANPRETDQAVAEFIVDTGAD